MKILRNKAFIVGYDERMKNPAWVAYRLPGEVRFSGEKRPSRFKVDHRTRAMVRHEDYSNTGFDRGHIAPNYAIYSRFGREAQLETFLMSNICPQYPNFNRGIWNVLESMEAGQGSGGCWAETCGEIWVLVGPLYAESPPTLPCGVAVPSHFFRIILDEENVSGIRILAFIIPNMAKVSGRIENYLVSVDQVESRTALDFFSDLPDDLEERLESTTAAGLWSVNSN